MAANDFGIRFLNPNSDRIDFGSSALGTTIKNLSTFSHEMWIKVDSTSTNSKALVYCERQGTGSRIRLGIAAYNDSSKGKGKLVYKFSRKDNANPSNYTYTLPTLWDDYWHHIAFTANIGDKEYCLYFDGALVATGSISDGGKDGSNNPLKVANTDPLSITLGAAFDGTTYTYWWGKIDEVRLWSSVLSQNDIQTRMNDHLTPPLGSISGLIAEWRLNEGSGTSTGESKSSSSWTATLKRAGVNSSNLWNPDRPFMGGGDFDETPPPTPTANAPTNISTDSADVSWSSVSDNVYTQYYELSVATDNAFSNLVEGYTDLNVGRLTSWSITDLIPNTHYYWRVRSVDAALNASTWATYNSNAGFTTDVEGDLTPPDTVVATAASSITDVSWTANWNATTDDTAVAGYKLDVALDSAFTRYLGGFRNLDVGLVLTKVVDVGVQPATTHYYRVRAYDAALNESNDSNVITVRSSDPPDTIPPNIVVLQLPTSIGATQFTANWNVGVDNVGVQGYRLDVARDELFTDFYINNLDVGYVHAYGINGVEAETGYYYRVRAYDAAGNISSNSDGQFVLTFASNIVEGGNFQVAYDTIEDTYTNESSTATNYGTDVKLVVSNESTTEKIAYLKFDLSEVVGTLVNADLVFNVETEAAITVNVAVANSNTWSETLHTYANNTLSVSGDTLTFTPSAQGFVSLDVASLLTNGFDVYTFIVWTVANDTVEFSSRETDFAPYLELTIDPSTITDVDSISLGVDNAELINYLKNPSCEIGGTSFGGATGITALVGATLTQDNTYSYEGSYSVKAITPANSDSGVKFESATGLAIAADGQTFKGIVSIRANSAVNLEAFIKLLYTDASSTSGTAFAITTTTDFSVIDLSVIATTSKTIDKVELYITQPTAVARTFWADAAAVVQTESDVVYFDGDFFDAEWGSTANASLSRIDKGTILAESSYIGDGNSDNDVAVAFKLAATSDWVVHEQSIAINRSSRTAETTIGPLYRANRLFNPSFTEATSYWGSSWSASVTRITTDGLEDSGNADLASVHVIGDGGSTYQGLTLTQRILAKQNDWWTFSVGLKRIEDEDNLELALYEMDSSFSVLATHTQAITLTDVWARYSITAQFTNASTKFVAVSVLNPTATASSFLVDHAMLDHSAYLNAYVDGNSLDGHWSGRPHESESFRAVEHNSLYDVQLTWADDDGVIGTNPISSQITTTTMLDTATTIDTLTLTPSNFEIAIECTYLGDEDEDNSAVVQWKRADLAVWSQTSHTHDRGAKRISATINGLRINTKYDVKVSFKDATDAVYGGTIVDDHNGYVTAQAITQVASDSVEAPMMITFGGFILQGEDNGFAVNEHDADAFPMRRTQVEDIPRSDGAAYLSNFWGKRIIKMKGFVYAETRAELNERLAALRKALAYEQQPLVVDTLDSRGLYFTATCTSLDAPQKAGENFTHVGWEAEFTCADPFRYETTDTVEANVMLSNEDTVAISNLGDLYCEPIFQYSIKATSGNYKVTIMNLTTGERIKLVPKGASGDLFVVDTAKRRATKNYVDSDYDGTFPILAVGQNDLQVFIDPPTYGSPTRDAQIALTVRRRHRFL